MKDQGRYSFYHLNVRRLGEGGFNQRRVDWEATLVSGD